MIASFAVATWFFLMQYLVGGRVKEVGRRSKVLLLVLSWIVLETYRIYCQASFPDIPNYADIFEEAGFSWASVGAGFWEQFLHSEVEVGYSLLMSAFKLISYDYNVFLLAVHVLELAALKYFVDKYGVPLMDALPIFLCLTYPTFQIGMLRQALAMCLVLVALVHIKRKLVFVLFVVIAASFHLSALMCLLLVFADKPLKLWVAVALFLVGLGLYLTQTDIVRWLLPLVSLEGSPRALRVFYYLDDDRANSFLGIGFWERVLFFVSMCLVYARLHATKGLTQSHVLFFNLGLALILLQMVFYSSPTITSRLRYFIVIFPALFISQYIYQQCRSVLRWGYRAALTAYLLMYLYFLASYLA